MMELLLPLAGLLSLTLVYVIAQLILGPVSAAAGILKAPTRFQLSDVVWLLVLLQVALGFCVQVVGVALFDAFVALLTFLVLAAVAIWGGAVSFLSRAGVTNSWRRGCFVLIQLPGTLLLMMGGPLLLVAGGGAVVRWLEDARDITSQVLVAGAGLVGASLLVAALVLVGWGLRQLAFWVVANSLVSKPRQSDLEIEIEPAQPNRAAITPWQPE